MPQLIRAGGDKWLARVLGGGWNFKPHQKKANVEKRRSQLNSHVVHFVCAVTARHVWGSASVLRQTAGQLNTRVCHGQGALQLVLGGPQQSSGGTALSWYG